MKGFGFKVAQKVVWKDLKILLRERGTLLQLFVVPIVFIVGFSSGIGGTGSPQVEAITLPVVNLDPGSGASQVLLEALDQAGGIECKLYDEGRANDWLQQGKIRHVLTIPASYGADLEAGRHVTLRLINSPDADPTRSEAVQRVVTGVAAELSLKTQLIASFQQMGEMQAAAPDEQQAFTADIIVDQAESQFERARTSPLLSVEESWPERLQEDTKAVSPLSLNVPGFAVLFIFLTAQTTAQAIYEEKKAGSFRRLLAAPVSRASVLVGKMTPTFLTGLAQIIVLFATGVLVLPRLGLGTMTLGNDPLALVLVCLIILLCSTALGLFIAAVARTEGQIGGLSQLILWVFGFAGIMLLQLPAGSMLEAVRQVIPHYWANTALVGLIVRGQHLADIVPSLLPLLGFTAVFFGIGFWRFEFN